MKKNNTQAQSTLDPGVADELLSNVLSSCDLPAQKVPLSILQEDENYVKERFGLQRAIAAICLLLLLLIPLIFVKPKLSFSAGNEVTGTPKSYTISIDSLIPIASVSATLDDSPLSVSQTSQTTYQIQPLSNGQVTFTVSLKNHQTKTLKFTVHQNDTVPPYIVKHHMNSSHIYLFVADDDSGVDYDGIYAQTETGDEIKPKSYDKSRGLVIFKIPESSLNIFIPDLNGNVLQTILTPR